MLERRIVERRENVGLLASTIINSAPFRGKDAQTVTPFDFFPDQRKRETPERAGHRQTPEDHEKILTAIFKRPPEKAA